MVLNTWYTTAVRKTRFDIYMYVRYTISIETFVIICSKRFTIHAPHICHLGLTKPYLYANKIFHSKGYRNSLFIRIMLHSTRYFGGFDLETEILFNYKQQVNGKFQ